MSQTSFSKDSDEVMVRKKLRVAVIGPKGQCGQQCVNELLLRGHQVVGISRLPPETWPSKPELHSEGKYSSLAIDISNTKGLSEAFSQNFDAIICAYGPPLADLNKVFESAVEAHGQIKIALLSSKHEGPFIFIGGAGSLHTESGVQLVDTPDFAYSWWYKWSDVHLDYMSERAKDHGVYSLLMIVKSFKWARSNVEKPGMLSWLLRPVAVFALCRLKIALTSSPVKALITGSRAALRIWEGVRDKSWTFLSPPGELRDKGVRTGNYKLHVDLPGTNSTEAIENGIYNEDMAVAIVDECENNKLAWQHWSCTGPIGSKKW